MKTLYLLRHAKSSKDQPDLQDFDRPLNDRGYADAHLVSKYLTAKKVRIDTMITSPAIRTMSTALIFAKQLNFPFDKILLKKQLYNSDVEDYLICLSEIKDGDRILLVGHNESISELAQKLSINYLNSLRTCAIACFQFNISSWKDIGKSKGDLIFEVDPDILKEE